MLQLKCLVNRWKYIGKGAFMEKIFGTAVILLDQSIGELRTEGHRIIGVDFLPNAYFQIDRLAKKGHSMILVVTQRITADELASIKKDISFMTVLAGTSLEMTLKGHKFNTTAGITLFSSIDRKSRQIAVQRLKLDSVPHLTALEWVLDGKQLYFAKILSRRQPDAKTFELLPYYIEKRDDEWMIVGLITDSAMLRMFQDGDTVDLLPFDYRTEDCGFLRIDSPKDLSSAHWGNTSVLASDKNRLLLAFSGPDLEDSTSLLTTHGNLEMLVPSPELLSPTEKPDSYTRRALAFASALNEFSPEIMESPLGLEPPTQRIFALSDAVMFQEDAKRYSGQLPLGTSGPIVSRHIKHPDNLRTVNELVSELSALGYRAYTHSFVHNGQTLYNVIADMPGTGYFQIKPEILKKLLKVLHKYPRPWQWPNIEEDLVRALGKKIVNELKRTAEGSLKLRLEEIFSTYQWLRWAQLKEDKVGFGSQIVLVGCHLDSTVQGLGSYNPEVDPAPGMDDNASGIAALLAAARYLIAFKGQLVHTVRFCFFNAEEAGLVGSKAYVVSLKSMNAPVKAVICTDMIGYNSDENLIFEIHAGYSDSVIRDLSLPIASKVETWASSLGVLQPAQIYRGTSVSAGAPDRSLYDPAINRSDHGAFHQQGYPAIVVTEDYFANMLTEPGKDPNPNYHTSKDNVIDANYGTAIANAIACTVKELATS